MACLGRRLALLALLAATLPVRAEGVAPRLEELAAWLSGTFDSKEQADSGREFPAVRMVTVAVPKSRLSLGAPVLYREEAPVDRPDRPTVQRFFRLEEDPGGTVLVRVFELKDPITAAGKWRDASDLALFGKNDVRERDGCLVTFRRTGDRYEGGTSGTRCMSSVRGAAYATSEARIWKDRLEVWDRGWNAENAQVWGPEKGPMHFVKRSPDVPRDPAPEPERVPAQPVAPAPAAAGATTSGRVGPPGGAGRGTVSLTGMGRDDVVSLEGLRRDPSATDVHVAGEGAAYRGVPLAALLEGRGLPTGPAGRRALAFVVLVATGADDSVSAFSVEEILLARDSFFLVFERGGEPLEAGGPVMLLDAKSPTRTVRNVVSMAVRSLAPNPKEERK